MVTESGAVLGQGQSIGNKRIVLFNTSTVSVTTQLILEVTAAKAQPIIRSFDAHYLCPSTALKSDDQPMNRTVLATVVITDTAITDGASSTTRGPPTPGGPYGLARTPPLGFRTWNAYQDRVSQPLMETVMEAMVAKQPDGRSLADLGYRNFGLDGEVAHPRQRALLSFRGAPSRINVCGCVHLLAIQMGGRAAAGRVRSTARTTRLMATCLSTSHASRT